MPEFTSERLIPGEVDVDLFDEHMARYAFAARSLWAGCGAGCQINTRLGVSELESHRA